MPYDINIYIVLDPAANTKVKKNSARYQETLQTCFTKANEHISAKQLTIEMPAPNQNVISIRASIFKAMARRLNVDSAVRKAFPKEEFTLTKRIKNYYDIGAPN